MKFNFLFLCTLAAVATSTEANASQLVRTCQLDNVAAFENRVHVHCRVAQTGAPGSPVSQALGSFLGGSTGAAGPISDAATAARLAAIGYFAVESGSPLATRVLQLGATAVSNGRTVDIFFDDGAGANPPGCLQNDCRRLIGLSLR